MNWAVAIVLSIFYPLCLLHGLRGLYRPKLTCYEIVFESGVLT